MIKRIILGMMCAFMMMFCVTITAEAAEMDETCSITETEDLPYIIANEATYFESSEGFGSGRRDKVNADNQYTTVPCYAAINGYSYLDVNGNIISAKYDETTNDITIPEAPGEAYKLFVHFRTAFYRNGWVDYEWVSASKVEESAEETTIGEAEVVVEEVPKTPEEIVEEIETEIKNSPEMKTTIVIDYSGSMDDDQKAVVDLLNTLQLENTSIIVFANTFEEITLEELESGDFYVGTYTYLYPALNYAVEIESQKIILISDLYTDFDVTLASTELVESVTIYDPDGLYDRDERVLADMKENWANAKVTYVQID